MIMIVCTDKDWAIGYKGGLIYRIREDMNHFRKLTMGHPVVMGRKTFESIGKPLPGRENIVITSNPSEMTNKYLDVINELDEDSNTKLRFTTMNEVETAARISTNQCADTFVIGGASIYEYLMPYINAIELTRVRPIGRVVNYDINCNQVVNVETRLADTFLRGFEFYSENKLEYENNMPTINSIDKLVYNGRIGRNYYNKEFAPIKYTEGSEDTSELLTVGCKTLPLRYEFISFRVTDSYQSYWPKILI